MKIQAKLFPESFKMRMRYSFSAK